MRDFDIADAGERLIAAANGDRSDRGRDRPFATHVEIRQRLGRRARWRGDIEIKKDLHRIAFGYANARKGRAIATGPDADPSGDDERRSRAGPDGGVTSRLRKTCTG